MIEPKQVDGIGANLDLYATFASLIGGTEPSDALGYLSKDLSGTLLRGRLVLATIGFIWVLLKRIEWGNTKKSTLAPRTRALILILGEGCH